jgi:hypothetical protein
MTDEEVIREFMREITLELPNREQPVPDVITDNNWRHIADVISLEADRIFLNNYQGEGEQS